MADTTTGEDVVEVAKVYLVDGQLKFKILDVESKGIKKERIDNMLQEILYNTKHRWYPLEERDDVINSEMISGRDNPQKMFNSAHYIINSGRWNFSAPIKDEGD